MTPALFVLLHTLSATPTVWHAVIIGNNTSPTQNRPTLSFADDDALRYALTLAPLVTKDHRKLLATLDHDTTRLDFLGAVPDGPPTTQALRDALEGLKRQVEEEKAAGQHVGLYFFFAGHGDVEDGKGFLELADGRLFGDQLQSLLGTVRADEIHVVLDSCNSFFVMSPRKPGGRRFATPAELSHSLSRHLPNIGVFLSTSADAESWEWTELQSGVFSYLVRSGLAGPADLNDDGTITYGELRRFVAIAAQDVKNPRFRPVVFARAPQGQDDRPFLVLPAEAPGLHLASPSAERIVVRDREGTRWFEAHLEAGQPVRLTADAAVAPFLRIERLQGSHFLFPTNQVVSFDALSSDPQTSTSRGSEPSLAALFATPFGPQSVKAFDATSSAPHAFGVTDREFERLLGLVDRLAALERADQQEAVVASVTWASTYTAIATTAFLTRQAPCASWCDVRGGIFSLGWGSLLTLSAIGLSVATATTPGAMNDLLGEARSQSAQIHRSEFAERTERRFLKEVLDRQRSLTFERWVWGTLSALGLASTFVPLVADLVTKTPLDYGDFLYSFVSFAINTSGFVLNWLRINEHDALVREWLDERASVKVQVSLQPSVSFGVMGLALTGRF